MECKECEGPLDHFGHCAWCERLATEGGEG